MMLLAHSALILPAGLVIKQGQSHSLMKLKPLASISMTIRAVKCFFPLCVPRMDINHLYSNI